MVDICDPFISAGASRDLGMNLLVPQVHSALLDVIRNVKFPPSLLNLVRLYYFPAYVIFVVVGPTLSNTTCVSCEDTPLSVVGNIISLMTFAYAVLISGCFYVAIQQRLLQNAANESQALRSAITVRLEGSHRLFS
ncbi:hypothetical protein BDY21DRAFT_189406 [Lineolata rhizophorae]|uniref:Uncharacterized protein n=1 Tax=Lineolata rhizophorae TaxID=578093 RepID=A0A6A6P7G1_9PEZI|nr:hypothetical protein BDY21DRAFT_189406 [Lineolata rhizophorae]